MIGTCCLIFIIILLPPLGVFFMKGCGADFWINICLTILGYLPGHIHAFYVLIKEREQRELRYQEVYRPGGAPAPYHQQPSQGYDAVPHS